MFKRVKNKKGFTLIELIVVIAILGILAAVAVPKLSGFTDTSKIKADEATRVTLENAAKMYVAANPGATAFTHQNLIDANLIETWPNPQQNGKVFTLNAGSNPTVTITNATPAG